MQPDGLAISTITYGEVTEGVMFDPRRAVNMQIWRDFLAGFDVISITMEVAEVWADLRGVLRRDGMLLPDADLLIAATALRFGMTLVTWNVRHFERILGLELFAPERPQP